MKDENSKVLDKMCCDIERAVAIGKAAEDEVDDIGCFNFDKACITLNSKNEFDTELLSKLLLSKGVYVNLDKWMGLWRLFITPNTNGACYKNTVNSEAICRYLRELGYNCTMYYQMD